MTIFVTGSAGFISSNFMLDWLAQRDEPVVNLDQHTYAGNLEILIVPQGDVRHTFVQSDMCDCDLVNALLAEYRARAVPDFATESDVDRSIYGPEDLIHARAVGNSHATVEVCA